jgi:hypothetical protein
MSSKTPLTGPITAVAAVNEQHMLFLFVPIAKGKHTEAAAALSSAITNVANPAPGPGPDLRASTGVHFSMFYALPAGAATVLPVPTFQTAPNKALLVALAIYDADFGPYIQAFVDQPPVAAGLDLLLKFIDETGIVDPKDPTSAAYIRTHGGVVVNATQFYCLLMRYNFGDPVIPGASAQPPGSPSGRYIFGATFPGLTVGSILQNYPGAQNLWPWPPIVIDFEPGTPPQC